MDALGDFNANSSSWYNEDMTSNEDRYIEAITSKNGFYQETNERTHILYIL